MNDSERIVMIRSAVQSHCAPQFRSAEWLAEQVMRIIDFRGDDGSITLDYQMEVENARLHTALSWAVAEIEGRTDYDRPEQRVNCLAAARDALHYGTKQDN